MQGGRILIKVATSLGNRLTFSAKNCDFNIHNSHFKFNLIGMCLFSGAILLFVILIALFITFFSIGVYCVALRCYMKFRG
jgi:hypothetical protein